MNREHPSIEESCDIFDLAYDSFETLTMDQMNVLTLVSLIKIR
jgi:hypothetical protein